ncbi:hypothetical protein [Streptomyces sp. NBC_00140]|uniref:Pepco domain-containing protein n=1 Tax=Streptomyces sp. NBC_00140 TaxID=2975664 RepID=UPI00225B3E3A|nr:hypothetical protein [Streptomyces sp. NBC_00140]MCX5328083.1 hypothetical protein [Streptomyces sp. NBC_00140]
METTETPAEELTLPFWVSFDEDAEKYGDSMGLFGNRQEAVLRGVPLGVLRKNLTDAVDALQQVFADVAACGGALPLREAQLSFQVTAGGGVQFVGTAQMQSSRGIVLVFRQ